MATNPNSYSPLPENDGAGGITNSNTTNAQQKANFSLIWNFLAYLFGASSGSRKNSFNVLASEGGTFGSTVGVQGDLSVSGAVGAGGSFSTLAGVGCSFVTVNSNASGGINVYDRNSTGSVWVMYGSSGSYRIWHNDVGDLLTLNTGGILAVSGNVVVSSDARLKEDIRPIPNALSRIMQSEGVIFKRAGEDTDSIGVVAQKVEGVFPELVHKSEKGYLSVNYQGYVGALIEAVKEMEGQIVELKKQLEEEKRH